jgi:hypothetical protein
MPHWCQRSAGGRLIQAGRSLNIGPTIDVLLIARKRGCEKEEREHCAFLTYYRSTKLAFTWILEVLMLLVPENHLGRT